MERQNSPRRRDLEPHRGAEERTQWREQEGKCLLAFIIENVAIVSDNFEDFEQNVFLKICSCRHSMTLQKIVARISSEHSNFYIIIAVYHLKYNIV